MLPDEYAREVNRHLLELEKRDTGNDVRRLETLDRNGDSAAPVNAQAGNLMGDPNMSQEPQDVASPGIIGPPSPPEQNMSMAPPPVTPGYVPAESMAPHAPLPPVAQYAKTVMDQVKQTPKRTLDLANKIVEARPMKLAGQAYDRVFPPKLGEDPQKAPNDVVPVSTLAGADAAGKEAAPAPAAADTRAEPEYTPPPAPTQHTIAAHYEDQIGPEAWAKLSEAEKASFTAADAVHGRNANQANVNKALADQHAFEADERGGQAQTDAFLAQNAHNKLEEQARGIEEDAKHLANYHEDPNAFWNSRSTAQKVAGFIGIALGGFVQGARGGPNVALEQINRATDQAIDAQRKNYMANKDSLEAKKSAYGMAMERYNHDDGKARAAVRLAALDKIEAQAKSTAAAHAGTDTDNRLDLFLADTAKLRAEEVIKYKKWVQTRTTTDGGGGAAEEKAWDKYITAISLDKDATTHLSKPQFIHQYRGGSPITGGFREPGDKTKDSTVEVNTATGQARALNTDAAQHYQQRMMGADKVESAMKEAQTLLQKGIRTPADQARFNALMVEGKTGYVQMEGFNRTPSDTETHQLENMFPIGGSGNLQVLRGNDAKLEKALELVAEARKQASHTYLKQDPKAPAAEVAAEKKYTPNTGSESK